jgi:hypothetical protein
MDVASLLTLLLLALALAIQPWSVLAAVLLITSEAGVSKTLTYVSGWILALAIVAISTIALYPQTPKTASVSTWTSWVEVASGVALGGWLLLRSRKPAAESQAPATGEPKWMSRLDSMSPLPAFVLGAFLPNYAIVVAAVSNVLLAGLSRAWAAIVLVIFLIVASAGVAAPLLLLLFRRQEAPKIYQEWRAWLIANGQSVLKIVLVVVAVVLIGKGVIELVS